MRFRSVALVIAAVAIPSAVQAQYYSYPSFQIPRITPREYNFAAADGGDSGTSLLFQWRESIASRAQLTLDAGLADRNVRGADARFIIGGGFAYGVNSASSDLPLDLVFTMGVGGSFGDSQSFLRIPVGLSVGHRFEFDIPLAIVPYAHPRVSLDNCTQCKPGGRKGSSVGVDVDLGVAVELTKNIAVRAAALLAGSDFYGRDNGFGLSLVWTPASLRQ